ncbi:MAG: type II secretion system inner membrane protein GspF [Deltaproteobacteria bacterium]|nr:type II secretion system inner membrane protein GspF [Deltaproteobacteria bacterium]NND27941.1 type II secretion system inner membrane protein GspF [Myxococcales bacterium]MBT8463106.1 type II secretion system inner membrane protein GspF [Deltaproteobacteria bacterium]MBT8482848.1 type II secretion system inner membrane protein GspF [Deltaproteobacteria bacterium]NNK08061.1 type II secretion system inner membrane protein GspF [Myxococcales bacterium]
MGVYAYRGIDARGKSVKGVRDADSAKGLRALLKRDGVLATEILEQSEAARNASRDIDFRRLFQRVSSVDVAVATRQLSVLLRSGVPLVEAVSALIEQLDHPDLKNAFTDTRNKVNEGSTLADALRAHPKIFPPLYVNMVSAGEASGTLEEVLGRLADFLDEQTRLQSKVRGALAYPVVMAVVVVVILFLMMSVVVPKVTSIFENFNQALPWYTSVLIWVSDIFSNYWWLLAALAGGAIFLFRRWKSTDEGRKKWDLFVIEVPLFGPLMIMVAVARFSRTLATLLASGVPVLAAMDITRNVLGNTELMRIVENARDSVREGEGIAKPLRQAGRFPPIMTHMIAVGERTGQLEEMLMHVADAYDQQIEVRVGAMTSILEPVLIVVMGVVVGGIAFAILMPLLQLNEMIQ